MMFDVKLDDTIWPWRQSLAQWPARARTCNHAAELLSSTTKGDSEGMHDIQVAWCTHCCARWVRRKWTPHDR